MFEGIPFVNGKAVGISAGSVYDGSESWCCDPCSGCGRVYSNRPSYKENGAKLAATCEKSNCPLNRSDAAEEREGKP